MRNVLVVDDDFMVAEIHRRFVGTGRRFARSASHALAQALSAARELRPHLILLTSTCPI